MCSSAGLLRYPFTFSPIDRRGVIPAVFCKRTRGCIETEQFRGGEHDYYLIVRLIRNWHILGAAKQLCC
jgi:hypothetical protein